MGATKGNIVRRRHICSTVVLAVQPQCPHVKKAGLNLMDRSSEDNA